MNKRGILAEKTGYFFVYIILFGFAALYFFSILGVSNSVEFNTESIEDSVVATRVLNCFSDDNFLLDKSKMNVVDLRNCFGNDKYFLEIKLDDKDVKNIPGELHFPRKIKRYVKLKNNEKGILEIKYVKKKNAS